MVIRSGIGLVRDGRFDPIAHPDQCPLAHLPAVGYPRKYYHYRMSPLSLITFRWAQRESDRCQARSGESVMLLHVPSRGNDSVGAGSGQAVLVDHLAVYDQRFIPRRASGPVGYRRRIAEMRCGACHLSDQRLSVSRRDGGGMRTWNQAGSGGDDDGDDDDLCDHIGMPPITGELPTDAGWR